ncbi:MAG: hypothetical protein FWF11_00500 [Coriobacteriia bacterium]|nr:hypothetical protein [Coriobacteriia bacterium]
MSQASHYLDVLSHEIGPRPAASDSERQAAEWLLERFEQAEIPAEMHDFDTPRFPKSARMLTYLLVPLAVFGIGYSFFDQMWVIHWTCWSLLAVLAVLTILDLFGPKGPSGLINFLPKGPSQNVIAKSIPSSYTPGEKPKKVILLANYDSALTSPLTSEATAALYRPLHNFANTIVVLMPLLALLLLVKSVLLAPATIWIYYLLLALCIPGAILLINQLIARLMKRYSPGANNNASGVAAMLCVMDQLLECQHGHSGSTSMSPAIRMRSETKTTAVPASVAEHGPELTPSSEPLTPLEAQADAVTSPAAPTHRAPSPRSEGVLHLDTVEFGSLSDEKQPDAIAYASLDDYDAQTTFAEGASAEIPTLSAEVLDIDVIGIPADSDDLAMPGERQRGHSPSRAQRKKAKKSLFSFGKKKDAGSYDPLHNDDPSNWLGVDQDFHPRAEGKAIGSWTNFDDASGAGASNEGVVDLTDSFAPLGGTGGGAGNKAAFGDDFGVTADDFDWKSGFAGDDPIEDDSYASAEAARIRRKVLDSVDLDLKEKEVWFVATGAHFAACSGARAFIQDYGDQVRDGLFINLSSLAAGDLYWSSKESFGRTYPSSARLTSMIRRLSRESNLRIGAWKKKALISDAGPLLAAGRKAVTITRLADKGIPFADCSVQDTAARLDSSKIDEVASFVCSIIREA